METIIIITTYTGLFGMLACFACLMIMLFGHNYKDNFDKWLKIITCIFTWVAMTGICLMVTSHIFPSNHLLAVISAVVAALLITGLMWFPVLKFLKSK